MDTSIASTSLAQALETIADHIAAEIPKGDFVRLPDDITSLLHGSNPDENVRVPRLLLTLFSSKYKQNALRLDSACITNLVAILLQIPYSRAGQKVLYHLLDAMALHGDPVNLSTTVSNLMGKEIGTKFIIDRREYICRNVMPVALNLIPDQRNGVHRRRMAALIGTNLLRLDPLVVSNIVQSRTCQHLKDIFMHEPDYVLRILVADLIRQLLVAGVEDALLQCLQQQGGGVPAAVVSDSSWLNEIVALISKIDAGRARKKSDDHVFRLSALVFDDAVYKDQNGNILVVMASTITFILPAEGEGLLQIIEIETSEASVDNESTNIRAGSQVSPSSIRISLSADGDRHIRGIRNALGGFDIQLTNADDIEPITSSCKNVCSTVAQSLEVVSRESHTPPVFHSIAKQSYIEIPLDSTSNTGDLDADSEEIALAAENMDDIDLEYELGSSDVESCRMNTTISLANSTGLPTNRHSSAVEGGLIFPQKAIAPTNLRKRFEASQNSDARQNHEFVTPEVSDTEEMTENPVVEQDSPALRASQSQFKCSNVRTAGTTETRSSVLVRKIVPGSKGFVATASNNVTDTNTHRRRSVRHLHVGASSASRKIPESAITKQDHPKLNRANVKGKISGPTSSVRRVRSVSITVESENPIGKMGKLADVQPDGSRGLRSASKNTRGGTSRLPNAIEDSIDREQGLHHDGAVDQSSRPNKKTVRKETSGPKLRVAHTKQAKPMPRMEGGAAQEMKHRAINDTTRDEPQVQHGISASTRSRRRQKLGSTGCNASGTGNDELTGGHMVRVNSNGNEPDITRQPQRIGEDVFMTRRPENETDYVHGMEHEKSMSKHQVQPDLELVESVGGDEQLDRGQSCIVISSSPDKIDRLNGVRMLTSPMADKLVIKPDIQEENEEIVQDSYPIDLSMQLTVFSEANLSFGTKLASMVSKPERVMQERMQDPETPLKQTSQTFITTHDEGTASEPPKGTVFEQDSSQKPMSRVVPLMQQKRSALQIDTPVKNTKIKQFAGTHNERQNGQILAVPSKGATCHVGAHKEFQNNRTLSGHDEAGLVLVDGKGRRPITKTDHAPREIEFADDHRSQGQREHSHTAGSRTTAIYNAPPPGIYTPARRAPLAGTRSGAMLNDDVIRKSPIVHFSRQGPVNQGIVAVTERPYLLRQPLPGHCSITSESETRHSVLTAQLARAPLEHSVAAGESYTNAIDVENECMEYADDDSYVSALECAQALKGRCELPVATSPKVDIEPAHRRDVKHDNLSLSKEFSAYLTSPERSAVDPTSEVTTGVHDYGSLDAPELQDAPGELHLRTSSIKRMSSEHRLMSQAGHPTDNCGTSTIREGELLGGTGNTAQGSTCLSEQTSDARVNTDGDLLKTTTTLAIPEVVETETPLSRGRMVPARARVLADLRSVNTTADTARSNAGVEEIVRPSKVNRAFEIEGSPMPPPPKKQKLRQQVEINLSPLRSARLVGSSSEETVTTPAQDKPRLMPERIKPKSPSNIQTHLVDSPSSTPDSFSKLLEAEARRLESNHDTTHKNAKRSKKDRQDMTIDETETTLINDMPVWGAPNLTSDKHQVDVNEGELSSSEPDFEGTPAPVHKKALRHAGPSDTKRSLRVAIQRITDGVLLRLSAEEEAVERQLAAYEKGGKIVIQKLHHSFNTQAKHESDKTRELLEDEKVALSMASDHVGSIEMNQDTTLLGDIYMRTVTKMRDGLLARIDAINV